MLLAADLLQATGYFPAAEDIQVKPTEAPEIANLSGNIVSGPQGFTSLTSAKANAGPQPFTSLIVTGETEPNDTPATATPVPGLGNGAGQDPEADISGVQDGLIITAIGAVGVDPGDSIGSSFSTGILPGDLVILTGASIGDGAFGGSSGDFDFYSVTATAPGQELIVEVDTDGFLVGPASGLDSIVGIYDSSGTLLYHNDDPVNFALVGGSFFDSTARVVLPTPGTYHVAVGSLTGFGTPFDLPADPTTPGTGPGAGSTGTYDLLIGLDAGDQDFVSVELEAGDVLGANLLGGGAAVSIRAPDGSEMMGSFGDLTGIHPASSPLPGGGANAAIIAPEAGTYSVGVSLGFSPYTLQLRTFRPGMESKIIGAAQTIFVDFDGEMIDTSIFGAGGTATLSPLSTFLPGWGLGPGDESDVIDSILASIAESLDGDLRGGVNGNFDTSGVPGEFDVTILNSRDHADPFGLPNVSRLIIGGTIGEIGFSTIGIAESIDPGNFDSEESAVVLLDLLSAPAGNPNSLNTFALDPSVDIIDLIGVGVGNIAVHEAGHYLGNWHQDQFYTTPGIMDQGGNLAGTLGLGDDLIFGTVDDVDVDFGAQVFVPSEGLMGVEDTADRTAFGLSTGTRTTFNPFERLEPLGSLIAGSFDNIFGLSAGLSVSLSFFAEAGETISAIVEPFGAAATLSIELVGVSGPTTAAAPGDAVVLAPLTIPADGEFEVRFTTDVDTGVFADLFRNTSLEFQVGDSDDGNELAIDDSFLELGSGRFGVLGYSDVVLPGVAFDHYNDGGLFIDISGSGTALGLSDDGEATVTTTVGNAIFPAGDITIGANGGVIGEPSASLSFVNQTLPSGGFGTALLPFWDDLNPAAGGEVYFEETTVGGIDTLIVQWQMVPHFPGTGDATVQLQLFASGPVAARYVYPDVDFGDGGLNFGASATIGYQENASSADTFSFNSPVLANGDVIDLVTVGGEIDVDEYTVDLTGKAGEPIDIVLAGQEGVDFSGEILELLGIDGTMLLATGSPTPLGVPAGNYDLGILDFVVPADGVFTIRVTSIGAPGAYGILVTDPLIFDTEPNNNPGSDTLRSLDDVDGALGFLEPATGGFGTVTGSFILEVGGGAPVGLEHDGAGNLYVTDIGSDEVLLITTTGALISSFSYSPNTGNGLGITVDATNLYLTDTADVDVDTYLLDGTYVSSFSVGAQTTFPEGITFDPGTGDLLVVDGDGFGSDTVFEYTTAGALVDSFPLGSISTDGIAYDPIRDSFWVYDSGSDRIRQYDRDFVELNSFPGTASNGFANGEGVAVIGDTLYVVASGSNAIVAFDLTTGVGEDNYTISLEEGENISLTVEALLDHADHDPINLLNPALEVIGPSGTVALDFDSLDGKNAAVEFTAPETGTYVVRVFAEDGTVGEYLLSKGGGPSIQLDEIGGDSLVFDGQGFSPYAFVGWALGTELGSSTYTGYGTSIDLGIASPTFFADTFADENGDVFASLELPPELLGTTVYFQAFEIGPIEQASNILMIGSPLSAKAGEGSGGTAITDDQLSSVAAEAVQRWASLVSPSEAALLNTARFSLGDLGNGLLGLAAGSTIFVDATAAGHGWFVDGTPASDDEFTTYVGGTQIDAASGSAADGVDLLTVLMHELGHALGRTDLNGSASSGGQLMTLDLAAGSRRLIDTAALRNLPIEKVDVRGSAADDVLTVNRGDGWLMVNVNGERAVLDDSHITQVFALGQGGSDKVIYNGGPEVEQFNIWPGRLVVLGGGYRIVGVGEDIRVVGQADDRATMLDSPGDDRFVATPAMAHLHSDGFDSRVYGAGRVLGLARRGGDDQAIFVDSAGNDQFLATPAYARMTGADFWNQANGFEQNYAYANRGGSDLAIFVDSAGDDRYRATPAYARMWGEGFWNQANGFEMTRAQSVNGGSDRADLFDSAGADLFVSRETGSLMRGDGFSNFVRGFELTRAHATAGGNDVARIFDSQAADVLYGRGDLAALTNDAYRVFARGFDRVVATSENGGDDELDVTTVDYLFAPLGDW